MSKFELQVRLQAIQNEIAEIDKRLEYDISQLGKLNEFTRDRQRDWGHKSVVLVIPLDEINIAGWDELTKKIKDMAILRSDLRAREYQLQKEMIINDIETERIEKWQ